MPNTTYAKQFIRFANTYIAGSSAITAFTVVENSSGTAITSNGGEVLGVAQHDIPSTASNATASRLLTVAESGHLIVNCVDATAYNGINIGTALQVNASGLAINTGGVAVTMNGTTPTIVDKKVQGGVYQVIVRFS